MVSRLVPGTSALCMIVRLTGEGWTGEGCGCALSDSSIANVMRAVQSVILLNMVHSCSMACADPCGLDDRTPLVAGSDNAVTVAACSLAMISGGVLAGTNNAYQDDTSKPGTPDSAMVGSSGAVGKRFSVVTASPRSCPERTVCSKEPVVLKAESTRPAMVSVMAPAPAPR